MALEFADIYSATPGDGVFRSISEANYTVNSSPDTFEGPNQYILHYFAPPEDPLSNDLALLLLGLGSGNYSNGSVFSFSSGQTITTVENWAIDPSNFASNFSVYLIDSNGVSLSDVVSAAAIPESSTLGITVALCSLVSVGIYRLRPWDRQRQRGGRGGSAA